MNTVFDSLSKYGFHDIEITQIKIKKHEVDLYFKNGLYYLDENGIETTLSRPIMIKMLFYSNKWTTENLLEVEYVDEKIKSYNGREVYILL